MWELWGPSFLLTFLTPSEMSRQECLNQSYEKPLLCYKQVKNKTIFLLLAHHTNMFTCTYACTLKASMYLYWILFSACKNVHMCTQAQTSQNMYAIPIHQDKYAHIQQVNHTYSYLSIDTHKTCINAYRNAHSSHILPAHS